METVIFAALGKKVPNTEPLNESGMGAADAANITASLENALSGNLPANFVAEDYTTAALAAYLASRPQQKVSMTNHFRGLRRLMSADVSLCPSANGASSVGLAV